MDVRVEVVHGNIVAQSVDAIVNAANETMLGGGGVDGAIHRAAGPELLAACRLIPEVTPGIRCPTGQVRITPAFRLKARFVIHAVGPVWRGGRDGEPELLASCYRGALRLATEHRCSSIAFPGISTGVFGYPIAAAAEIAVREVRQFQACAAGLERVVLVAFSADAADVIRNAVTHTAASN
jgi:O-acetyl-ADP-ribose deacetylase (regulator of RNase III)